MIIYGNTKNGFIEDIRKGIIATKVQQQFEQHGFHHSNDAEYRAWANSLMYMRNVLDDEDIPGDVSLAVEYQIPLTSKRVDFLIAGKGENESKNVVVVELKQWEDSGITSRPDVVTAFTGGANRAVCHPCYQAWGMLDGFITSIDDELREIVLNDKRISDYYKSEEFAKIKETCDLLTQSKKEFNEYINEKAQSITQLFGTRIVRNETENADVNNYVRAYKKSITPFTAEVSSTVFGSAENNPMGYIVKYFYPNKSQYKEQIEKLRILIERLLMQTHKEFTKKTGTLSDPGSFIPLERPIKDGVPECPVCNLKNEFSKHCFSLLCCI